MRLRSTPNRSRVRISEIEKMARKPVDSNELFIDGLEFPIENRIGEEGQGFRYLLHGLNPERILVAASALGADETTLQRATDYAKERVVFGRPTGGPFRSDAEWYYIVDNSNDLP